MIALTERIPKKKPTLLILHFIYNIIIYDYRKKNIVKNLQPEGWFELSSLVIVWNTFTQNKEKGSLRLLFSADNELKLL